MQEPSTGAGVAPTGAERVAKAAIDLLRTIVVAGEASYGRLANPTPWKDLADQWQSWMDTDLHAPAAPVAAVQLPGLPAGTRPLTLEERRQLNVPNLSASYSLWLHRYEATLRQVEAEREQCYGWWLEMKTAFREARDEERVAAAALDAANERVRVLRESVCGYCWINRLSPHLGWVVIDGFHQVGSAHGGKVECRADAALAAAPARLEAK